MQKITVYMVAPNDSNCSLLCIGDSMTRSGVYISQVIQLFPKLKTFGLKCYDGEHFAEGRGGWTSADYFTKTSGVSGISPFLFPKTVDGQKYFGDAIFWKHVLNAPEAYECVGLQKAATFFGITEFDKKGFPTSAQEGDVVNNNGLFKKENGQWLPIIDEFCFDFSKYIKKFSVFWGTEKKPNVVSILLGANDFYNVPYDQTEKKTMEVLDRYDKMITSIKCCSSDIKIVLNLPVLGAGASYPEASKSNVGIKRYCYNILSFCEKILEKWDNESAVQKGIYVCPMMNFLDMENEFDKEYIEKNKYTNDIMPIYTNWIHPSVNGYKQMGNILAGVITHCMK